MTEQSREATSKQGTGLSCPRCGGKTEVRKTVTKPDKVRRKRRCLNPACNCYFGTVETVILIEKTYVTPPPVEVSGTQPPTL